METSLKGKPLLYSTVTEIAYRISREYYNNVHYVWCTSSFDAPLQPGSSNPRTLCNHYLDQIIKLDCHAKEISDNKAGILKGSRLKLNAGIITQKQFKDIAGMVKYSQMKDFCPTVFLIHKLSARKRCIKVSTSEAASNLSVEYIIEDLHEDEFDIIHLNSILNGVVPL